MSWIVRYSDDPLELGLPSESACYMNGEREKLDAGINSEPVGFTITDKDGKTVASGQFFGQSADRDWPLEQVRIFSRKKSTTPTKLVYADGQSYSWSDQYQAVIND